MKKLLNTLFITRQGSSVQKERETIVVKCDGELLARFPIHNIGHIFCFGRVYVSPYMMGFCAEKSVGLTFLTEFGRFLCHVVGQPVGNVLLRREQFRRADCIQKSTQAARVSVVAKIANCRTVLQRELRNHGSNPSIQRVIDHLAVSIKSVKSASTVEGIRGIEGEAAKRYFSVFNLLMKSNFITFPGRVKHPATDPINALLSFSYALITNECVSATVSVGLDPYVGFLHRDRPGRPSLALDLLEEFRASWADRLVLSLINRKVMNQKDFETTASGAVRLLDNSRKRFIDSYQQRKQVEILHPYLRFKVPIGLLPHCQALLLARHIRGDTEHYTPFLAK